MLRILPFLSILSIVLLSACENEFSPKADYVERIVVFSILDRSAAYQVVRLERTFDADGANPTNPIVPDPVTEATVTISARNSTSQKNYVFHDSLFTLSDGSLKRVWISRDMPITEGTEYTLKVDVPGFDQITGVTQVPSRGYTQVQSASGFVRLTVVDATAYPASGYYFRMWVTGTKMVDGRRDTVRREVPTRVTTAGEYEYPEPSRDRAVNFSTGNMLRIHAELREKDGVTVDNIVGIAYSLDQYLYSYYKLARGFDDPVSVRQDSPDISNIRNGVGIFGAIFPDSVRVRFSSVVQQ